MMRRLRTLLFCAAAFTALAAPAAAEVAPWGDIEVMSEEEMSDLRGGFAIAPGVVLNFGATVTTYLGEQPILTTQLNWSDAGPIVRQVLGAYGQSIRDLTPVALAALGIDGLSDLYGVLIEDENGVTAVLHNVNDGSIQNIIINNANGRDLYQEIDIQLELEGFEAMQQSMLTERLGMHFIDDLRAAPQ